MRIRSIKPEFWTDATIVQLSHTARLLFVGLWNYADDAGRFLANPLLIKAAVFPLDTDIDSRRTTVVLRELYMTERIRLYKSNGGNEWYGDIPNFLKHQRINKPTASKIPPFTEDSRSPTVVFRDYSGWEIEGEQGAGSRRERVEMKLEPKPTTAQTPKDEEAEVVASPPTATSTRGVLEYECDGTPSHWMLTEQKLGEWQRSYPHLDVRNQCQRAWQWLRDNPSKRKTANGMPRFLNGWLGREQNQGGGNGAKGAMLDPNDESVIDAAVKRGW